LRPEQRRGREFTAEGAEGAEKRERREFTAEGAEKREEGERAERNEEALLLNVLGISCRVIASFHPLGILPFSILLPPSSLRPPRPLR
jgi:hypothetical protein